MGMCDGQLRALGLRHYERFHVGGLVATSTVPVLTGLDAAAVRAIP